MGIKDLAIFLARKAPNAVRISSIHHYSGRKVAVDTSISIYNSLIRTKSKSELILIENDDKPIVHLLEIFSNVIKMVHFGIEPVYVFEGKPPKLKYSILNQRELKRGEAQKSLDALRKNADALQDPESIRKIAEEEAKLLKKVVRPPTNYKAECKKLLGLMGIPFIQAPSEAEAQCAALCKAGKVFAAVSEDMDTLAFSSPILLRGFTKPPFKRMHITELNLQMALKQLNLTQESFIDLCILMGCDYCDTIQGIGPHRALDLIKQHGSIEAVIKDLGTGKYYLPDNFNYEGARELFLAPDVTDTSQMDLKWVEPNKDGLIEYLVEENGFNKDKVLRDIKVLQKGLNFSKPRSDFWLL